MNQQKGFANIVLIVLVVVLAGVVGYFAFVRKSTPVVQTPLSTQTPTPTQVSNNQQPIPAPVTSGETAKWKTYRNTDYGFEIKYPPSAPSFENVFRVELASSLYFCPGRGAGDYRFLSDLEFGQGVEVVRDAGFCSAIPFDEYVRNYVGATRFVTMQDIQTMEKVPAYYVQSAVDVYSQSGGISGGVIHNVFIEHKSKNNRAIRFILQDRKLETTIKQIFSTFKLLK